MYSYRHCPLCGKFLQGSVLLKQNNAAEHGSVRIIDTMRFQRICYFRADDHSDTCSNCSSSTISDYWFSDRSSSSAEPEEPIKELKPLKWTVGLTESEALERLEILAEQKNKDRRGAFIEPDAIDGREGSTEPESIASQEGSTEQKDIGRRRPSTDPEVIDSLGGSTKPGSTGQREESTEPEDIGQREISTDPVEEVHQTVRTENYKIESRKDNHCELESREQILVAKLPSTRKSSADSFKCESPSFNRQYNEDRKMNSGASLNRISSNCEDTEYEPEAGCCGSASLIEDFQQLRVYLKMPHMYNSNDLFYKAKRCEGVDCVKV